MSDCPDCDCTAPESIVVTILGTPVYTDLPPVECIVTNPCGGTEKVLIPWDNEKQHWQRQIGEHIVTLFHRPECDQCL